MILWVFLAFVKDAYTSVSRSPQAKPGQEFSPLKTRGMRTELYNNNRQPHGAQFIIFISVLI